MVPFYLRLISSYPRTFLLNPALQPVTQVLRFESPGPHTLSTFYPDSLDIHLALWTISLHSYSFHQHLRNRFGDLLNNIKLQKTLDARRTTWFATKDCVENSKFFSGQTCSVIIWRRATAIMTWWDHMVIPFMEFQRAVKFVSSCCHDHIILKCAKVKALLWTLRKY